MLIYMSKNIKTYGISLVKTKTKLYLIGKPYIKKEEAAFEISTHKEEFSQF